MKQLLIVNSAKSLNSGITPGAQNAACDYSGLEAGAISFIQLGGVGGLDTFLEAKPTKNFAIALGRPNGQVPFVIPEVDVASLSVVKATPKSAVTCEVTFTVPDPSDVATLVNPTSMVHSPIAEYGFAMIKKSTVPHERNRWSVMVASQSDSASDVATALAKAVNDKTNELFPFTAEADAAVVTITCQNPGEDWTIRFTDCLDSLNRAIDDDDNETVSITAGEKAVGDMTDIQDLASRCAAGKGFTDVYRDGDTVYPGYPEVVENTTYNVYTLRFRVGRDAAKTRDERVWQVVHIAVPVNGDAVSDIEIILGISVPEDEEEPENNGGNDGPGNNEGPGNEDGPGNEGENGEGVGA